jgi:hypothetical protein
VPHASAGIDDATNDYASDSAVSTQSADSGTSGDGAAADASGVPQSVGVDVAGEAAAAQVPPVVSISKPSMIKSAAAP